MEPSFFLDQRQIVHFRIIGLCLCATNNQSQNQRLSATATESSKRSGVVAWRWCIVHVIRDTTVRWQ